MNTEEYALHAQIATLKASVALRDKWLQRFNTVIENYRHRAIVAETELLRRDKASDADRDTARA